MVEGHPRYKDFQRRQAALESGLERSASFAHRWAIRGGRTEDVYVFGKGFDEARQILGDEEVEKLGKGNLGAIGVAAVRKILAREGLDGVDICADLRHSDGAEDMVVISLKAKA